MRSARMLCIAMFCLASAMLAQKTEQGKAATEMPTLSSAIDKEISNLENQFVAAVEAMPEDKFNASPEDLNLAGSQFKGVRTFATQIRHVAADNFAIWAPLTGKPEPAGIHAPNGPEEMKSRAEILSFLRTHFHTATRRSAV
jgi:hypothetical protein